MAGDGMAYADPTESYAIGAEPERSISSTSSRSTHLPWYRSMSKDTGWPVVSVSSTSRRSSSTGLWTIAIANRVTEASSHTNRYDTRQTGAGTTYDTLSSSAGPVSCTRTVRLSPALAARERSIR